MKKSVFTWLFVLYLLPIAHGQDADSIVLAPLSDSLISVTQGGEHAFVEPATLMSTRKYKDETIEVRKFDREKWKEITGSINYDEAPLSKAKVFEDPKSDDSPWQGALLKVVSYTVILVLVILGIYSLWRNISVQSKLKKTILETKDHAQPVEEITAVDLDSLLKHALSDGNLRVAVRAYYLLLLRKLNETGLISWKKDKTNRDYLVELTAHDEYLEEVKKLTFAYEQIWYGDHALNLQSFQRLVTSFEFLNQRLNK